MPGRRFWRLAWWYALAARRAGQAQRTGQHRKAFHAAISGLVHVPVERVYSSLGQNRGSIDLAENLPFALLYCFVAVAATSMIWRRYPAAAQSAAQRTGLTGPPALRSLAGGRADLNGGGRRGSRQKSPEMR